MGVSFNPFSGQLVLTNSSSGGGGGSVSSVNGQSGIVVLTQSDIGLGNVDNTSDANKPISTATQSALDALSLNDYKVYKYTLQSADISSKSLTINATPQTATKTRFVVIGGPGDQDYGPDFTVSSNILSWNGLFLDGVLAVGDKVIVIYN